MKPRPSVLLAGMIAATFATSVIAMPTGAAVEKAPGAYPMDCAKAKDKVRCASLNQKIAACKDKTDDAWRECIYQPAPATSFTSPRPRDCREARNRAVCEAHAGALEVCKDTRTRAEHRNCVGGQLQAASLKND